MMMRTSSVILLLTLAHFGSSAAATVPWHNPLALANNGYWPQRVAVTITNNSDKILAGQPVEISLPELAGARLESLRVCRSDGVELLYDLRDHDGAAKRVGTLTASDRLIVPFECAGNSSAPIFVYTGNDSAWAVPDFLPAAEGAQKLPFTVSPPEGLQLRHAQPLRPKANLASEDWAEVRARNFGEQIIAPALVRVNLRSALARLPGAAAHGLRARVRTGQGVEVPSYALRQGSDLLFSAELPPRAEELFQVELARERSGPGSALQEYNQLLESRANLVANGSFEAGEERPDLWAATAQQATQQVTFGFSSDAQFGQRSAELRVGANPRSAWIGWNSREIPVRPGGTYLLSGWLKAVNVQGSATIHAHFHNSMGALAQTGAMASTQPSVSGDSEWSHSTAFIQAPPDATTIQLHLTMNNPGTLRHDGIVLCEIVDGQLVQVHAAATNSPSEGLHIWQVNPLVKVFTDSPPQTQARRIELELGRNEYEPFELAARIQADKTSHLEIWISALTNSSGAALPAVKVDRVGFVPIDYPSAYYSTEVPNWCRRLPHGAGATDGWADWWPDPLAPASNLDLIPGRTQPLWFTVRAPKSASPGEYYAVLAFRSEGLDPMHVPLTVRVLPFTLPEQTHLRAIFDLRFGPGGSFGSGISTEQERRRWLRFMAEHRLGIDAVQPPPRFSYKDGKVSMDATEFDEAARFCFDELGMNVSYTPQFFYLFGWAYPPKKFFGLEPFTPEWTAAFKQAYQLFSAHVREKGWHDKFVYYISDEPHFQQQFVVDQMKKLCAMVHDVDASIPIYSSTWRHCAAWDDSLDLWGIGQYGCFPVADMERLQKAGKQMWFTCDGQMATDTPFLATERMLPYYCFKYGVHGFEFWGFAWWTYDPWKAGWHQFIRQSDEGKRYYWVRYPDGDGFLAYPGKELGLDGPASSIRLEQVREGLEDYEALILLSDLAAQARQAGAPNPTAERALSMAKELVIIPNAGGLRSTEILPDPDRIPAIRKAVNAALVELFR